MDRWTRDRNSFLVPSLHYIHSRSIGENEREESLGNGSHSLCNIYLHLFFIYILNKILQLKINVSYRALEDLVFVIYHFYFSFKFK